MWQHEIEGEVARTVLRLAARRAGATGAPPPADASARRVVDTMNEAFPDARLPTRTWVPLVGSMLNDPKDRHVLAAAAGAPATHVVTSNLKHFPVRSRPSGVAVVGPDAFALLLLRTVPDAVLLGLTRKVARHRHPPHDLAGLAEHLSTSRTLRRFGAALADRLDEP